MKTVWVICWKSADGNVLHEPPFVYASKVEAQAFIDSAAHWAPSREWFAVPMTLPEGV